MKRFLFLGTPFLFVSSAAHATAVPPVSVPIPLAGAGGPVGVAIAVAGYVGYKIYKRRTDD